jgi:signal transduction histidine kinase
MEALAAIVAHELRAGVLGVTSAAQLLRYALPPDPVAERSLGRILQEAERLSALHEALTEYATGLPPRLATGSPDDVWAEILKPMRGPLEAKGVRVTHSAAGARVQLDREQLGRSFERVLHHAAARVLPGAAIDVVSSVEDGWWSCAIAARDSESVARSESDRATFLVVLGQRAIVSHGGELTDHPPADAPLLVSIRLPLSLGAQ